MSKRRHLGRNLRIGGTTALVLLLAIATLGTSSSAAVSSTTANNGVLVIDNAFNNKGLDPQHEFSVTASMAHRAMYDTLLQFKGTSSVPKPDLATSWVVSKDHRSITFNLRKDVKFSDGTPLTAKDVVFSYARLVNLKWQESFLLAHLQLRALGKYKVVLESDKPNPALLRIVEAAQLSVVNRKQVVAAGGTAAANASTADKAEQWFNSHSAGSGPYMLKSFTPQQQIVMVPNPHYWGPKPKWKQIIIRNVTSAAQLLSVQRGTNEVAFDISATQVASLKKNKNVQVWTGPSTSIFFLGVNMRPGVTQASNPHILKAIRYAIDYQSELQLAGPGAVRLPGIVPIGFLGALPRNEAIRRDLAKARAEIAASGIKNPTIDIHYVAGFSFAGVSVDALAQKVQSSLEDAGLKVNLKGLPIGPYLELRSQAKLAVTVSLAATDYPDPNDMLQYAPGGSSAVSNWGYTAEMDPAGAALAAKAQSEMNDKKRAALFQQLQRHMNSNSPFIPEFQAPAVLVASKNLTGIVHSPIVGLDVTAIGTK